MPLEILQQPNIDLFLKNGAFSVFFSLTLFIDVSFNYKFFFSSFDFKLISGNVMKMCELWNSVDKMHSYKHQSFSTLVLNKIGGNQHTILQKNNFDHCTLRGYFWNRVLQYSGSGSATFFLAGS